MSSRHNYPFQNALRKHPDAFEWEVVEDTSDQPLLEQALLDMWFGTEMCYNLSPYADRPECDRDVAKQWGLINGPLQGQRHFDNQTGIFSPNAPMDEWRQKGGAVAGAKSFENKTGLFREGVVTRESCSSGGKIGGIRGGISTSKQRWRCLVTGHISTPGALTNYQRKRGISTDKRERLS